MMMRLITVAVIYHLIVTSIQEHTHLLIVGSFNISNMSPMDIAQIDTVEYLYVTNQYLRIKREAHSLIGPFDLTKLKKRKNTLKQQTSVLSESALAALTGSESVFKKGIATNDLTLKQELNVNTVMPNTKILFNRDLKLDSNITNKNSSTDKIMSEANNKSNENVTSNTKSINTPIRINVQTTAKPKKANKQTLSMTKSLKKDATNPKNSNNMKETKVLRKSKSVRKIDSVRETRFTMKKKSENETTWPAKHAAVVEGDIIIGGLMMVHGRASGSDGMSNVAKCGPLMAQGGVQALETMLFALDEAQRIQLPPPAVRLGALVLDDCDSDTRGLEMALDFIKGSISNIDDEEYACNASALRKVISGVVGAASSVTSVQVANLLRLFKIPQVSFFSTSPELSNKARFEYFTRTIPSDLHQVKAMVEIVKILGWRYVSIIYEESNYGIKAFEELETLLARNDICIAVKERLTKDSGAADEKGYDDIVERLLSRPRARGVIVFGSDQEVAGVMAAVRRRGAESTFGWVGSDGWSARALVAAGNEPVVEGTISVQPQANPVRGFREYFLGLTPENNPRNPWFVEFWEEQFRCRYPGAPRTPYNGNYKACSGRERLSIENTEFEAQLQFVADAVWAFVHAIRDMHRDFCGDRAGLCEAMRPVNGPTLLRYLRQVRFTGLSGDEFHFDQFGDGPARYNILHFKQVSRGVYRWLRVGKYLDGELQLNMNEIQFKWGERRPPESVCSAECELGQAKQYVEGESCCWHCFNCTQYEIRSPYSETACVECPQGTLPDITRTHCASIPELYLQPSSPAAIGAMAFSALGIILTILVVTVWILRGSTPVVRASGRELSFVLLTGILMCYLVTFALVLRPTNFLCSLQRFGTGFCFTVVYAALLTKTNRISRIFDASKFSARRPSFISPKSQMLICLILISIQVVIVIVWQLVSPARAIHHYPTREDNMLVCDSYVDASYTIAFFYPVVLIVVCTVYAVFTRKIPEAFNESKHIGFTMYTTCVIWLAFVPLYFGTASHVPLRVTSMAVTISLSASVTLACLFAPKVYIIIARPERNVRAHMMTSKWRNSHGRGTAPGAVCAALIGAAPLPAATPSTDISTLDVTERSTSTDRHVQTEDLTPSNDHNGICLDAKKLAEIAGGLPTFNEANVIRRRATAEPALRVAVAVVGGHAPL